VGHRVLLPLGGLRSPFGSQLFHGQKSGRPVHRFFSFVLGWLAPFSEPGTANHVDHGAQYVQGALRQLRGKPLATSHTVADESV